MELSEQLFEQIVAALGPPCEEPAPAGAEVEKRRDQRFTYDAGVLMKPFEVASAQPRMVRLRNVSRSGAAVLDGVTRQIGEKIVLYLPRADGAHVPIVCAVMNTRMSGSAFRLGVQFVAAAESRERGARGASNAFDRQAQRHVLDELALRGFVAASDDGAETPPRVRVNVQGLMSGNEYGHAGLTRFVTLYDISAAGVLSVLHPDPLARGLRFNLQVACPSGEMLTMLCTVIDSRQLDDANSLIEARFEVKSSSGSGSRGDGAPATGLVGRLKRWFAA